MSSKPGFCLPWWKEVGTNVKNRVYRQKPAKNLHKTTFNSCQRGLSTFDKFQKPLFINTETYETQRNLDLPEVYGWFISAYRSLQTG
jgi:hypothetical protein